MGIPEKDIEELLNEHGLSDNIPKLKEAQITPQIFWELEEGQLESVLDVKVYGQKKSLFKQMQSLLKEHKKNFEK